MKNKLAKYPDNHFSAVVTIPPVDILPIESLINIENDWNHIYRVIKPGANIIALTENNYAETCAQLRLANMEIRDTIQLLHENDMTQSIELFEYIIKLVMPPVKSILLDPYQRNDIIRNVTTKLGHDYIGIPI